MNRRQFLSALGASAAVSAIPGAPRPAFGAVPGAAQAAANLTTLAQTIRPGRKVNAQGYRLLTTGPGEAHTVRDDLIKAEAGRERRRRSLLSFAHLTDQHIIDVQSPTRVEFLDRYSNSQCESIPFQSAHRPQEAACARIADAMLQRLRRIAISPVTGAPIAAAICTGDNTDNQQRNELDWFMKVMDGGSLNPNSGNPTVYEGVQKSGDLQYWHPDPRVEDFYKTRHGFPDAEGWLEDALSSFRAVGAGIPWYTCFGNHDGLAQGNAAANAAFEEIGTGPVKVTGLADTANPCDSFSDLGLTDNPPFMLVTADPRRDYVTRREWIARHLETTGKPAGHGFTQQNVERSLAYYATDVGPLRFITLDSVNPGGLDSGSIGEAQLTWLEAELAAAQKRRQLVLLFSHHGLRSLDNPNQAPDPFNPGESDLPRFQADEVEARIAKYDCIIAWVNGHSHENIIVPRKTFWDIGTAAHIDWPAQARIVDVVDNRDGTLSIFTTLFDHEETPIASFARELAGNDPQKGFPTGSGKREDRNTELLLPHPFARQGGAGGGGGAEEGGVREDGGQGGVGAGAQAPLLPATGGGSLVTVGGAAAVAAAAGLLRFRERSSE